MKQSINKVLTLILFIISLTSYAGIEEIFEGETGIKDPSQLRDPFKAPPAEKEVKKKEGPKTKKSNGVYTNVPDLGIVPLEDIKITGVLIGRERRAILSIKSQKEPYIIKEGAKLGKNQAEVKAIVPGGLILVEKVTNIYGESEYLETVIPISK